MRVALEYNYERVTSRLGWTISTILDDLAQGKKG
jgi:hypothetical protein